MKQTSVEWLWEQIDNTIPFQNIQTSQIFNGLLEQAKAIHKEEIINARRHGFTEGTCFGATTIYKYETSEDYISNLKLDI